MKKIEYGKQNSETILLLHGGGLSWWNYKTEAELLGERYRVVLPILDGHAGSDDDFVSIEESASRIMAFIDDECGGSVLLIGGLSLGAQIAAEILSRREEICRYAVLESASAIPSKWTRALVGPLASFSHGLIRKKWFAGMQFRSLRIRADLFDDYYRDTSAISKHNLVSFLKASTAYKPKRALQNSRAKIRVVVGGKEQKSMLRSAKLLHNMLPGSRLEIKDGLRHGEYSINHPRQYVKELLEALADS